jgi:transcriptional regulator with XRE-family HTH domain
MDGREAVMAEVGDRLLRLRSERGYDLDAAAAAAGLSAERLCDAEAGAAALSEAELGAVADAYGIDPSAIFGDRITRLQDYA